MDRREIVHKSSNETDEGHENANNEKTLDA
jgi:hypothetical protein